MSSCHEKTCLIIPIRWLDCVCVCVYHSSHLLQQVQIYIVCNVL